MTEYLFLFQIGPVQSFIAQARRTSDLYVGSRILTMLATAGVEEVLRNNAALLFPALLENGDIPKSVPHRFAFISADGQPQSIGERVEAAIRYTWWSAYGNRVGDWLYNQVGDGDWVERYREQLEQWLEMYWCAVQIDQYPSHGEAYKAAAALLNSRKAVRHYPQVEDQAEYKCTMTGSISALVLPPPMDWPKLSNKLGKIRLRENERLSAIALVKRFAGDAECRLGDEGNKRFPSTTLIAGNEYDREDDESAADLEYPYLAVLHMDGDRMGELLGKQTGKNAHAELSLKLSQFSRRVEEIFRSEPSSWTGELVYAGGDDVLAFLPLKDTLRIVNEIRKAFEEVVGGTISAGIAIMGVKTPLDSALDAARSAEEMAKDNVGRNALVVRDMRSTTIRDAGAHWTVKDGSHSLDIVYLVTKLQGYFADRKLSVSLGHDMLSLAHDMGGAVPADARKTELGRLIRRRTEQGQSLPATEIARLIEELAEFGEQYTWQTAAQWVILAHFFAKGGKREMQRER